MPSKSEKQKRFMAAAAHNPEFADKAGISQDVAKEFNDADTKKKKVSESETYRAIMEDLEKIFHGPDAACCQDVFIPDNRDHKLPDSTPPFTDDREEVTPTKPKHVKIIKTPYTRKIANKAKKQN